MELKDIVFIVGGLAGCLVLYLAMWVLAMRRRKPMVKVIGGRVALGVAALIAINGLNLYFQNQGRPDLVSESPGPPSGSASTLREVEYAVMDSGLAHLVEVTMRAEVEAKGTLALQCRVLDPQRKVLKTLEQNVVPAGGKFWSVMRFDFQPESVGDHVIAVEIPSGVDIMKVVVKELK